jgi:hypothetical protein
LFANGESVIPEGSFDTDDSSAISEAALNPAGIAYQLRMTVADYLATSPCRPRRLVRCMLLAANRRKLGCHDDVDMALRTIEIHHVIPEGVSRPRMFRPELIVQNRQLRDRFRGGCPLG